MYSWQHRVKDHQPSDRFVGPCGIAICRLDPCPLFSHRSYVEILHAEATEDLLNPAGPTTINGIANAFSSSRLVELSAQRIERSFTDGLPSLPLDTSYMHQCRDLIYHHITDHMHRLRRIFTPHVDPLTYTRALLESIYSNPILAVCLIGHSQVDRVMQSRACSTQRSTEIVYGIVLRTIRERFEQSARTDTQWLLLLVVALTVLEVCVNQKPEKLKPHRTAIENLVTASGGLGAIGFVQNYIQNTDRFISLCTGEYPLYASIQQHVLPMRASRRYGQAFSTLAGAVDPLVIDCSQQQALLIEMLEDVGVDLTSRAGASLLKLTRFNALESFISLREQVTANHAVLHASYHDSNVIVTDVKSKANATSISRCVVLASHIVAYREVYGDFYTIVRPIMGSELQRVLQQKPRSEWDHHNDIVIWVLFVLATVDTWSGHQWTISELRQWLSAKYGHAWPCSQWSIQEEARLKDFVWSQRASQVYDSVCEEILSLDKVMRI